LEKYERLTYLYKTNIMRNKLTRKIQQLARTIIENKTPGDVWRATSPMMKIKLLKRLGVEDESTAKKYIETYKDKSWDEVKKAVSDLTMNENKSNKMKKSELKAKIKEMIMAETSLYEAKKKKDEAEDEISIEDDTFTPEPEANTPPAAEPNPVEPAEIEPEIKAVQDALNKAQEEAEKLGDKKLLAQIGNTITFFTRAHISEPGRGEPK
jgi:hypothetical protein